MSKYDELAGWLENNASGRTPAEARRVLRDAGVLNGAGVLSRHLRTAPSPRKLVLWRKQAKERGQRGTDRRNETRRMDQGRRFPNIGAHVDR